MRGWEKHLARATAVLVMLLAVLYLGDWLVWRHRVALGSGYGVVEVDQFLATSLKGSKTEYDLTGTQQVKCVRTIFPHQAYPACWWVERNKAQWQ